MTRSVAITGASGLIGRHLCEHFARRGWRVRALMRDTGSAPLQQPGIERERLVLPDAVNPGSFAGFDTVIHAAYATRAVSRAVAERVNVQGARAVLDASRSAGVRRFVFLSSFAAHDQATSYYGRSKRAIEEWLDPSRDLIVRPGLVLARDGGLGWRMWQSVLRAPVVPLVGGGRQRVQTVHVDDLCTAIETALDRSVTGGINVAEPVGLELRELLALFARASRVSPLWLPVPGLPVLGALRAFEALGLRLPVTSDNLRGLLAMKHVETAADLARLGLRIRTAAESVAALAGIGPSA